MITHVVILWVREGDETARDQLLDGAKKLAGIPGVMEFRSGRPVPSDRAVVDSSFAVALTMTFADQEAAGAYQSHPIHEEFVRNCVKPLTSRVVVYDFG